MLQTNITLSISASEMIKAFTIAECSEIIFENTTQQLY